MDAGSHPVIRQYVEILQGSYTLLEVERLNPKTGMGVLRKEKKYYFLDPLVMAALVSFAERGDVDPTWPERAWKSEAKQGHWIENVLAAELRKTGATVFYDERFGGEIDFVFKHPDRPLGWSAIEVKRGTPSVSELRPLSAYPGGEAWVFHLQTPAPASVFALTERLLRIDLVDAAEHVTGKTPDADPAPARGSARTPKP